MKRIIILVLLIFTPIIINASNCNSNVVTIISVESINTEGNASEKERPTINNKTIGLDLSMSHVNDSITYKVAIKNNSSEDYEVNKIIGSSNYIKYSFVNNSNLVKAKSTSEVYIKAKYITDVPISLMTGGVYNERENIVLSLSTLTNPKTGYVLTSIIMILLVVSLICYQILNKEFSFKPISIIIITLLVLPISISAACKIDININSNVEIKKIAIFDTGIVVNYKLKALNSLTQDYFNGDDADYALIHFERSNTLPDNIQDMILEDKENSKNYETSNEFLEFVNNRISNYNEGYNLSIQGEGIHEEAYYTDDATDDPDYRHVFYRGGNGYILYSGIHLLDTDKFYVPDLRNEKYVLLSREEYMDKLKREYEARFTRHIISSDISDYPIYAWNDDGTVYYYCESNEVYLNSDSSHMFYLFNYLEDIHGIENVNTTKLEDSSYMFGFSSYYSTKFNLDLSSWNTSNVINMEGMFNLISGVEGRPRNMSYVINGLENFDTSKVNNFSYMFTGFGYRTAGVNVDISNWDTSNAKYMIGMFKYVGEYGKEYSFGDLSNWNTSNFEKMDYMFATRGKLDFGDISVWDTSKVTSMSGLFYAVKNFNLDITKWDTSKVTDMSAMFFFTSNINSNLSNLKTNNVVDMSGMFEDASVNSISDIGNISRWDTSKVKDMSFMFDHFDLNNNSDVILDLSSWNTSSLENIDCIFDSFLMDNAGNISVDLSNWNTSKIKNMYKAFSQFASGSVNEVELNISGWDTSKVVDMFQMFNNFAYNARPANIIGLSSLNTSNVENMEGMFSGISHNSNSFQIDLSSWNVSKVKNMENMFNGTGYNATIWSIGNLSNWNTSSVESMSRMFQNAGYNAINWSIGDISNWNTQNLVDITYMFFKAGYNSTTWNAGSLSNWNTSKVKLMSNMFEGTAYNAESFIINISSWNTQSVVSTANMFKNSGYNASTWRIGNLSNWNTANIALMESMFAYAGQNATTWDSIGEFTIYASKITLMFSNCSNAKATLNIKAKPQNADYVFRSAATQSESLITVNYTSEVDNINTIIATKSNNSNVVKGNLIE